jgi:serine/threonine protein phosphatase PrpC
MKLVQKLLGKGQARSSSGLQIGDLTEGTEHILDVGALTDSGRLLDHNEDALFVLTGAVSQGEDLLPVGLYIVADGVGGREGGAQASTLAVRSVAAWILDKLYRPMLSGTNGLGNHEPINQVLTEAAVAANSRIHEVSPDGGTTLTCAFVLGSNAFLAHVGDSRAYIISKNAIRQITTDHSLVNRLIEVGQLTPEEAQTHPQRHVLYRALGRAGSLEVDTYLQSLPTNGSLLLCSDGLWQMVPEEAMLHSIDSAASPQIACRRLIARANENGGEDNITAILVRLRS